VRHKVEENPVSVWAQEAEEWLEKGERAGRMVWLLSESWMDPLRGSGNTRRLLKASGWLRVRQGRSH